MVDSTKIQEAKAPSFGSSLNAKLDTIFNNLDTTKSGKITKQQFTDYNISKDGLDGKSLEQDLLGEIFTKADLNKNGLMEKNEFKKAMNLYAESQFKNTPVEAVIEFLKKSKDASETSHKVDFKIGEPKDFKTKLELKYFVDSQGEGKHFQHIAKNLNFSKDSLGVIFRIHSSDSQVGADTLRNFFDEVFGMASAMLPPDNPASQLLALIDYEVTNADDVISVGIKVKDDCTHYLLVFFLIIVEEYYHAVHSYLHAGVELNNDLTSLFTEGKSLTSLITDGAWAFVHLKTNSVELIKTALGQIAGDVSSFVEPFLQNGFALEQAFSAEEATGLCQGLSQGCCPGVCEMTTDQVTPMAQMIAGPVQQQLENPPLPILAPLVELGKTNLKTNFSLSFKIAEGLLTFHFKTSGIGKLLGY